MPTLMVVAALGVHALHALHDQLADSRGDPPHLPAFSNCHMYLYDTCDFELAICRLPNKIPYENRVKGNIKIQMF